MIITFDNFIKENAESFETVYIPKLDEVYVGKLLTKDGDIYEIEKIIQELRYKMVNKVVEFDYEQYILSDYDDDGKYVSINKENEHTKDFLFSVYYTYNGKEYPPNISEKEREEIRRNPDSEYRKCTKVNIMAQGNMGCYFIKQDQTVKIFNKEKREVDPYDEETWEDDNVLNKRMISAIKMGMFKDPIIKTDGEIDRWRKRYKV